MAIIKAGTYRFNDVLSVPNDAVGEKIDFTVNIGEDKSILAKCTGLFTAISGFDGTNSPTAITLYFYVNSLEPNPGFEIPEDYAVYFTSKGWYTDSYGEGIKTITITTDSEVSPEFYEWFSANAVEQKQISGKWKFKDVVGNSITDFEQFVNFTFNGIVNGSIVTFYGSKIYHDGNGSFAYTADSSEPDLTALGITFPLCQYVYHGEGRWGNDEVDGIDFQTIDFGTEPQYVSADFYNWMTGNASPLVATITYNGETIVELFKGQTATLKCTGMKMEDDVVVTA